MGTLVPENTGTPPRMPGSLLIAWALIDLTSAVPFTRCVVEDNYVRSENVGRHGAASASVISGPLHLPDKILHVPFAPCGGDLSGECSMKQHVPELLKSIRPFVLA